MNEMSEFTTVIAALVAFAVTAGTGFFVIPYLRKLKFGQTILDIGPNWHKGKQDTPTMGGIMMVAGVLIGLAFTFSYSAMFNGKFSLELKDMHRFTNLIAGVVMALLMCVIGFMDDYIKVVKKRNLGLTAKQKTLLQLLISAAYLVTLYLGGMRTTNIPFIGDIDLTSGIGLLFWPIAVMFIYGFTNAVNLIDGLDGLACGVSSIASFSLFFIAILAGEQDVAIICAALAGGCMGFLPYNFNPAKLCMGDSGALLLGFILSCISIQGPFKMYVAFSVPFLILGLPIFDTTFAIIRRLIKHQPIMAPDRGHLHHRLIDRGFSQKTTVIILVIICDKSYIKKH